MPFREQFKRVRNAFRRSLLLKRLPPDVDPVANESENASTLLPGSRPPMPSFCFGAKLGGGLGNDSEKSLDNLPPWPSSISPRRPASAPPLAEFQYSALSGGQIRVLNLHPGNVTDILSCSLTTEDLGLVQLERSQYYPANYVAVSYCWGSSERPYTIRCNTATRNQIKVDGGSILAQQFELSFDCSLRITESAKSLLAHLRDTEQFQPVWMDAICINQENEVEKAQQVKLMADIYSRASKVIVWLGEADENTMDAFEAMKILAHMDMQNASRYSAKELGWLTGFFPWHLPHEDPFFLSEERWSAFQWLLQSPWFTRTWIFQEIVQARRAVVRCGDYEAPWKLLEKAYEVATALKIPPLSSQIQGGIGTLIMPSIVVQIPRFRQRIQQYRTLGTEGDWSRSEESQAMKLLDFFDLEVLMTALRNQNAGDPRDKVFGVYSLCIPDISCEWLPQPDYNLSAREVYIKTARYYIFNYGSVSLKVLSEVESFDSSEAWPGVQGLPSWVPDWSQPITRELIGYAALCDATPRTPSMALVVEDYHDDQTRFGHSRATKSATQKQKMKASPGIQPCLCLKLTGVRVLQIHNIYETKLTKALVAHLNTLPGKYPTTDFTYPEVYPRIVEPSQPEHFQIPTTHRQAKFWPTLNPDNKEFCTRERTIHDKDDFKKYLSTEQRLAHVVVGLNKRGIKSGRKVCVTNGGFMGLVPSNALVGDEVALFWGAAIPYWIRKDGNHYKLVGEAYVYGIMGGEVMEDLDQSRVEDFLIC